MSEVATEKQVLRMIALTDPPTPKPKRRYRRADPYLLTRAQLKILRAITEHVAARGFAPSYVEIAEMAGLSAVSTVHAHVAALASKGFITKDENGIRSVELTGKCPHCGRG